MRVENSAVLPVAWCLPSAQAVAAQDAKLNSLEAYRRVILISHALGVCWPMMGGKVQGHTK